MPAPRSKKAPKMFEGDEEDIAEFLEVYECCADDAQLPKNEWVKFMFRYLDRSLRLTFEAFDGYANGDWDVFSASIKEAFGGAFQTKKCTRATLDAFIHASATKLVTTDTELRVYHRSFQGIAAYLINDKQLSEKDAARYYWFGLHPDTQEHLERRLGIVKPNHPREDPFAITDVYQAGCYIFNSNAFNRIPLLSTPSPVGSLLKSQGAEDTSRVMKKVVQLPKEQPGDVDELLRQLRGFKVEEASYMATYFQILAKDPSYMNMLQPPTSYAPALPPRQSIPLSHPGPPPMMARACIFCHASNCSGRAPRDCPIGQEYIRAGKVIFDMGFYRWPTGVRIQGHPQGLKASVDQVLQSHAPAPVIQEGTATYYRVDPVGVAVDVGVEDEDIGKNTEVDVTGERGAYPAMVSAAVEAAKSQQHVVPEPNKKAAQFQYTSKCDDPSAVQRVFERTLAAPANISVGELLSLSPEYRKYNVDFCKVNRTAAYSLSPQLPASLPTATTLLSTSAPMYSSPIMELKVKVAGQFDDIGLYDSGAELVCISKEAVRELNLPWNPDLKLNMRDANGGTKTNTGVVENLELTIAGISVFVHAWIIEKAPYRLLLGRPFQVAAQCDTEDVGETLIIFDPKKPGRRMRVPMLPHQASEHHHAHLVLAAPSLVHTSPVHSSLVTQPVPSLLSAYLPMASHYLRTVYDFTTPALGLKYKPVARKVRPVATTLPEAARPKRRFPEDPLRTLPQLSQNPPAPLIYGARLTKERWEAFGLREKGFLWEEEVNLVFEVLMKNEGALAWDDTEKGRFREDYFDPVVIPTVEHEPWALRNIPIPHGLREEVIRFIKNKIASGTYEPSGSSYRSRWFCVPKKNGKFRIVHDLQPLNAVTIKDAGLPPNVEPYAEHCAGRAIYSLGDLYVGYDHAPIAPESRDLTTFQTPLGPHRLTALPMGWSNSVSIFQGHVTFILQDELDTAPPFLDDVPIIGPRTRYELPDGGYETLSSNPGIRRFVWEHFSDVNRIFHRMKHAGGTFSAHKLFLGVPEVNIVGHTCNYEGRIPDQARVSKIKNWPACADLTEVRGFLGTCGVVRIFIEGFADLARPLVLLTRKDVDFVWGEPQQQAMDALKEKVISAPALSPIDYASNRLVIVAVDSSFIAVGWIVYQLDEQGRRKPSRYGSISWTEREARYSQSKLELHGVFRALKSLRLHLVGLPTFRLEVDAKYIKGMLNNPDIQPNNAINRWIAGILLFNFDLVHVPGKLHLGPDGLSRRRAVPEDEEEPQDGWVDEVLGLGVWVNSWVEAQEGAGLALALRPVGAFIEEVVDEGQDALSPLLLPAFPFPFLNFALQAAPGGMVDGELPRSEADARADLELLSIRDFLSTTRRPSDLDEAALKKFLKHAARFFFRNSQLWRRGPSQLHQLVVLPPDERLSLILQAHDKLGHKGFYSMRRTLTDRFWWPGIDRDVAWFIKTCHECQVRSTKHVHIPPIVATPAPLFRRVHVDTMHMPKVSGLSYILQGRCSLISYPEFRMLTKETGAAVGRFVFEDLLCRWGAVEEIVTDNGAPIVAGLDWLAKKYHISHIRISPYNKQANGIVERSHRSIRESIVKACEGDILRWPSVTPHVFWADRVTVRKDIGFSPFYMAHGIDPILPFDLAEATFLVPKLDKPLSRVDLLAIRARQLEKRESDLNTVKDRVLKARYSSIAQFEKENANLIKDYAFAPGSLVLVRNTRIENDFSRKTKPRYLGPLLVVRRNRNSAYILAELDGSVHKLPFAGFRLVPYYPRSRTIIPVTSIVDTEDIPADGSMSE